MKKVLFATTALVATAGVAAAELSLGGSARFGVTYNDTKPNELQIHNRFTLNIDGSASTDTGLDFFARVRIRGGNTGTQGLGASGVSAPRVGVSYNNFTLATGNILGAYESAPGLYDGSVGLTGLGWHNLPGNVVGNRFAWDSFSSAGVITVMCGTQRKKLMSRLPVCVAPSAPTSPARSMANKTGNF